MEEWFNIGSQLCCTTCLGTKIQGSLVAYDIAQKFMILRKNKEVINGCAEGTFDFVLVNIANVSAIDEIEDKPVSEKELEPAIDIDIKKVKEKLEASKQEKMLQAKLGDQGVTAIGLAIYETLKKTLGSQSETVTWNDKGQIEVFGEISIAHPYDVDSLRMKNEQTNINTFNHVTKIVTKYYQDNNIVIPTAENDKQVPEHQQNGNASDTAETPPPNVWSSRIK